MKTPAGTIALAVVVATVAALSTVGNFVSNVFAQIIVSPQSPFPFPLTTPTTISPPTTTILQGPSPSPNDQAIIHACANILHSQGHPPFCTGLSTTPTSPTQTPLTTTITPPSAALQSPTPNDQAIIAQQALAQTSANQISATGNGVLACPDSSTANISSVFNAITDQNGQLISGTFSLQTLLTDGSTATPLAKAGTITSATITSNNNGFTMTGTENTDTICGTAPGATITITGPCFPPPGATGTIQFSASNGEAATIQGNIACLITSSSPTPTPSPVPSPLAQLFKNQGQCMAFANHNPSNTMEVTKQECMSAFQNKFTNTPQQQRTNILLSKFF